MLVLDDFQVISDPVCHRTLEYVFDHLPRSCPPLPAHPRRPSPRRSRACGSRGELLEIRSADLAFTRDEAARAAEPRHDARPLDEPQVDRLWRLTEGWPAALYLAGAVDPGAAAEAEGFIASFERGHRHVFDYLGSEVLRRLPRDMRDFLTQTSILRRLSAPLCDDVLAKTDSASVIADLENENLFLVPLDGRREWYRYHHLFAALLRLELQSRAPGERPGPAPASRRWFERHGDVEDAIHHSRRGRRLRPRQPSDRQPLADLRAKRSDRHAWGGGWRAMPERGHRGQPVASRHRRLGGRQARCPAPARSTQRLAAAESIDAERTGDRRAPPPSPFALPLVRAINCFGDVGGSRAAARTAVAADGRLARRGVGSDRRRGAGSVPLPGRERRPRLTACSPTP